MNGATMILSTIVNPFICLSLVVLLNRLLLFDEIASHLEKIHKTCVKNGDEESKENNVPMVYLDDYMACLLEFLSEANATCLSINGKQ